MGRHARPGSGNRAADERSAILRRWAFAAVAIAAVLGSSAAKGELPIALSACAFVGAVVGADIGFRYGADWAIRRRHPDAVYAGLSSRAFTLEQVAGLGRGFSPRVLYLRLWWAGVYGTLIATPAGLSWTPGRVSRWLGVPSGNWPWEDVAHARLAATGYAGASWLTFESVTTGEGEQFGAQRGNGDLEHALTRCCPTFVGSELGRNPLGV